MARFLILPIIFQTLAMSLDEFYFHRKRVLPKWEVLGHPVDTFFTLLCFGYLLRFSPQINTLTGYILLAGLSCLIITKDEWVHKGECEAGEMWVHSILFILHPTVLIFSGLIWYYNFQNVFWILHLQTWAILAFFIYQVFIRKLIFGTLENK